MISWPYGRNIMVEGWVKQRYLAHGSQEAEQENRAGEKKVRDQRYFTQGQTSRTHSDTPRSVLHQIPE